MRKLRSELHLACAGLLLGIFCSSAQAQPAAAYPSKPVRFIVPFPAGSGTDIIARLVAVKLSESLKQQVVIDNRPGASTIIGTDIVAKAPPDGYTIIIASNNHAINSALFAKLPFDPVKDFAPVGELALLPFILVVHPSVPVKSVKDLIALAKANPGKLTYASTGNGTPPHVAGELLKQLTKIDIVHVPYKGSAAALTDVVAGQVPFMFVNTLSSIQFVRGGRLRAIAVGTKKRISIMPELPTVIESGVPGFDVALWAGVLTTAGTSPDIIAKLNREIVAVLALPDVKEKLMAEGAEVMPSTPDEFGALIVSEIDRLGKIARAAKMRVD
ncbi:MAG: tripartite tricarboxylate transporter substrate binding protein [Burkholderiales bacterium]